MVNADVFKTTVEDDLKEITKCKVDILLLKRDIEKDPLYVKNNAEIERLTEEIENRELSLEDNLSKSGEKKIDTSAGWCAYRVMPDRWEYDIPKLINWAKEDDEREKKYIKVVEEIKKAELKKDLLDDFLDVEETSNMGITITPQDPKFNYKLNGGL